MDRGEVGKEVWDEPDQWAFLVRHAIGIAKFNVFGGCLLRLFLLGARLSVPMVSLISGLTWYVHWEDLQLMIRLHHKIHFRFPLFQSLAS